MSQELKQYLIQHLKHQIDELKGFNALGNELDRTAYLKRLLKEASSLYIPMTDQEYLDDKGA
jgi:hypothetical protein